jgi:uncharacterized damage-inducible protein DinB
VERQSNRWNNQPIFAYSQRGSFSKESLMKRAIQLATVGLLTATAVSAQQPAAPQTITLSAGIQRGYANAKNNLTEATNKLPESDYGYKPTPAIRSFGAQFGHVANFHYLWCSQAKGEPNPMQGQNLEQKTTKEEFVKVLADSFAYCDPVFAALTDERALQLVKQNQNDVARGVVLTQILQHDNLEYGVLTVYLRLKELVPPSTERQQQGQRGR